MSGPVDVLVARAEITPEQLAEAFWEMSSTDQVKFFARLDDIAEPGALCRQMGWVVNAMVAKANNGDHRAWLTFRTMFEHAHAYHDAALELRCGDAKAGA